MKKTISILLGKTALKIGKFLQKLGFFKNKNISVKPAILAKKVNKDIIKHFKVPKLVIAVTGSSGKGSTSKLITEILRDNNYDTIYNDSGSNIDTAIITLLLEHCNFKGEIKNDALVMEVDERYAKLVFPYIKPTHVVITNITRDQPPRQGHFDIVSNEIKKALTNKIHLILNADDPYLQTFIDKNKVTYYSLSKTKNSYNKNNFNNLNIVYCPKCNTKLNYNFYHIESTGDYYCDCGFKKNTGLEITSIDYVKKEMIIDNNKIKLSSTILYSIYNTAAAFTTTSLIIDKEKITKTLNKISTKSLDTYNYRTTKITVLSTKAENNTTYNQALLYINSFKEEKTIIIGWNEISRRYNHFDTSWLYDIDFENLKNVKTIICVGPNRFDIATRIKYSNLNCDIKTFETLDKTTTYLKNTNKYDVYAVLNFDYVTPFNILMKEGLEC